MFWIGAIVSLCYLPGITGAYIATQWPVLSILLPFGLWRSGPMTFLHWLGVAFIAYATVRLAYAPSFVDGVGGLWMLYIMGLSFWLGSTLDDLRGLYAGLAVGASISSLVAVLQAFGVQVVPSVTPHAGIYVNSVAQGLALALIAVALISERMWLWVLPLVPGLVLAQSRGAWLMLAVGVVACYVRRAWLLVVGVAALGIVLYVGARVGSSDGERLFIWQSAATHLTWLGWGPGSFSILLLHYDSRSFFPGYAHNDALQLAFEYGIAALAPFAVFAFVLGETDAREWPIVVAFAVAGCYSMPLWFPVTSFLALVAAGRIVRRGALVGLDSYICGFAVVPERVATRYGRHGAGSLVVPVQSHPARSE